MGSVVAIIGAFVGRWINRNAAKEVVDIAFPKTVELLRLMEFQRASAKFRESMLDIKHRLEQPYPSGVMGERLTDTANEIIGKTLDRQRRAMLDFKYHLAKSERPKFKEAWEKYTRIKETEIDPPEEYIGYYTESDQDEPEMRRQAIDNLDKVLDFAEPQEIHHV